MTGGNGIKMLKAGSYLFNYSYTVQNTDIAEELIVRNKFLITGEKVSFRCPRQFTTTKIKSYLNSIGASATDFRFSVLNTSGPTGAANVVAQINQNNNLIVNTSNIYTYTEDSIISVRVDNVGVPATATGLKCYLIRNLS
jgi:hypothetical protein